MGLLSYWGEQNQVTHTALKIITTGAYVGRYNWNDVYEWHRIATKSFSFVGMNEAAARACADEMLRKYTRTFTTYYTPRGNFAPRDYTVYPEVNCSKGDGDMWKVDVSIYEDQLQYCIPYPESYMFITNLDYNELEMQGGYVHIETTYRDNNDNLVVKYSQGIKDYSFNSNDFHIEVSEDGNEWVEVEKNVSSSDGSVLIFSPDVRNYVRLRWKDLYVSNTTQVASSRVSDESITIVGMAKNQTWEIYYETDIGGFNFRDILVRRQNNGETTWTNITNECSIVANGAVKTNDTDTTNPSYYQIVYGDVFSNVFMTPYYPEKDVAEDNEVVLTGYFTHYNQVSSLGFVEMEAVLDSSISSTTDIKLKGSVDGFSWSDMYSFPFVDNGNNNYSISADCGNDITYLKFYNGDKQISNVFKKLAADNSELMLCGYRFVQAGDTPLLRFYWRDIISIPTDDSLFDKMAVYYYVNGSQNPKVNNEVYSYGRENYYGYVFKYVDVYFEPDYSVPLKLKLGWNDGDTVHFSNETTLPYTNV